MQNKVLHKLSFLGIDTFVYAIFLVIFLAYLFPQAGASGSQIPLDKIANYGVSLIFFFYGLRLSPEKFKNGIKNWKVHLLIQFSTFLFFPLLVMLLNKLFYNQFSADLWIGLFYLAVLPSTVSSSVVMVSIAKGNIPAAIFNASISGLIGVLLTPLWMSFWLKNSEFQQLDMQETFVKLAFQVLLPVLIGTFLHRKLGWFAEKYKTRLKQSDQLIILLIIYTTFCNSFQENIFADISDKTLLWMFFIVAGLFFFFILFTNSLSNWLKLHREDKITVMFCGSKKSLVHGTVFSGILFSNYPHVAVMLLPIMIYHVFQLVIISIMANKFAEDTIP